MTWPTIFANLAGGTQPVSLFDGMFNQVAAMIAIPCTASGQNSITLTPIGNAPTLAAYGEFNFFRFKAVATSNANVTAQFQSLANLPVYKADGLTQAGANDIVNTQEYVLIFSQALNGGAGGFFLEAASVAVTTPTAGSMVSNLKILNNVGTPNTKVDVSYDEIVMNNPSGGVVRATAQSFTIDFSVIGAVNGLDAGAIAASTIYAVWGISNGSTSGGLVSTSFTAPTMPSGYTFKKRLGAVITDGSKVLFRTLQRQEWCDYDLTAATNTTVYASVGTTTSTTYVSKSISTLVPSTAIAVAAFAHTDGTAAAVYAISPTPDAPSGLGAYFGGFNITASAGAPEIATKFNLRSATVYIVTGSASSTITGRIAGWRDNL